MAVWSKEYIQVHGDTSVNRPDIWPGVDHHPTDPPITIRLSIDSITRTGTSVTAVVSGGLNQSKTIGYFNGSQEDEWGYADDFYVGAAILDGDHSDVSLLPYVASGSSSVTTLLSKPYSSADASGWSDTKYTFSSKSITNSNLSDTGTLVFYFRSGSDCEACSIQTQIPQSDLSSRWYPVEAYLISSVIPPAAQVTISFNVNGGSGSVASITANAGDTITLPSYSGTKSVTLSFNANGGSVSPTSKTVSLSKDYWYTASSGGTKVTGSYVASATTTLYVHWLPTAVGDLPTPDKPSPAASYKLENTSKPWTTTQNGSTFIDSTYTISSDTTVYAKWMYLFTINLNGGRRATSQGSSSSTNSNITSWKKHGVAITATFSSSADTITISNDGDSSVYYEFFKDGYTLVGLSSSSSASSGSSSVNYTTNAPGTYYLVWEGDTFTVTFKDGYSANGQDVIEIVYDIPYGGSVTDGYYITSSGAHATGLVPQVGQSYNYVYANGTRPLKVFKKKGLYGFKGWTSTYTNITSDKTIVATWDFSPIWIRNSAGQWIPYKPVEH